MNEIIVNNSRKVSKCLKLSINCGEDLLKIRECNHFINKYKNYLEAVNKKDLKEFYEETGLKLTHIYKSSSDFNKYVFNEMGSSVCKPLSHNIYNHHLLVITIVDKIIVENNKIYADGKLIYDLILDENSTFEKECVIRNELSRSENIETQTKIISKYYGLNNLCKQSLKQIFLCSFGNLYVLNNDGILFCNNKEYEQNVKYIWSVDSYTSYIIFNDNSVEYLTNKYDSLNDNKYDKVIYGNSFIAFLKNKVLNLTKIDEIPDTSINQTLYNVDDIFCTSTSEYDEVLSLSIKNEKIDISINSIFIEKIEN